MIAAPGGKRCDRGQGIRSTAARPSTVARTARQVPKKFQGNLAPYFRADRGKICPLSPRDGRREGSCQGKPLSIAVDLGDKCVEVCLTGPMRNASGGGNGEFGPPNRRKIGGNSAPCFPVHLPGSTGYSRQAPDVPPESRGRPGGVAAASRVRSATVAPHASRRRVGSPSHPVRGRRASGDARAPRTGTRGRPRIVPRADGPLPPRPSGRMPHRPRKDFPPSRCGRSPFPVCSERTHRKEAARMVLLICAALLIVMLFPPTPVEERRRELQHGFNLGIWNSSTECEYAKRPARGWSPGAGR